MESFGINQLVVHWLHDVVIRPFLNHYSLPRSIIAANMRLVLGVNFCNLALSASELCRDFLVFFLSSHEICERLAKINLLASLDTLLL